LVLSFLGANGVPAPQLRTAALPPAAWRAAYRQAAAIMHGMLHWCRLVHADLSEYNLLWFRGCVHVIDVGQALDTSHPAAQERLEADAAQLTRFFARRGVRVLPCEALLRIVRDGGLAPSPPLAGGGVATGGGRTRGAMRPRGEAAGGLELGEPAEGEEGPEDSLEAFFSGTRGVIAAAVDAALGEEAGAEVEVEGGAPGQGPAGLVGEAAAET
jgi:hypothetical protein